jgi:hypothetical protein
MSLPSDMARCAGYDGEQKCESCARSQQLAADEAANPPRWSVHMSPAIQDGCCVFWIEGESPSIAELERAGQRRLLP